MCAVGGKDISMKIKGAGAAWRDGHAAHSVIRCSLSVCAGLAAVGAAGAARLRRVAPLSAADGEPKVAR